ncbi:MAG: phosphate uptake regulator PhoU [Nanoarchaeota archaeon]|nr:phosphate uptake regulator PhoU [Nanoarchaeota archaeon]
METRRVQKTGISTFTVSLPKAWVISNGIKTGDSLSIDIEKDQSLRIGVGKKKEVQRSAVIKLQEYKDKQEILRKFTAHYIDGSGKIQICSDKPWPPNMMRDLKQDLKKFIGFEIIEESDKDLLLQDFFTADHLSIKKAIKREYSISRLIMEETKKILLGEIKSNENISFWEDEVDKLYLLVRREINFAVHDPGILRQLDISLKECQEFILLIDSIEKMTDTFYEISANALAVKKGPESTSKKLALIIDNMLVAFDMSFNSIMKKDFNLSNQALEMKKKAVEVPVNLGHDEISEQSKKNLYFILASLHTASEFIEELAEIGLGVC